VVELLLAKDGVDPDSKDKYHRTPLSWAVIKGQEAVVELLLAKDGIDPDPKDRYNETLLSLAANTGHSDIAKLLLKKYKENGIIIRDEDVDIATHPEADHRSRVNCDICMSRIPDFNSHYHCGICSDGDFDICQKCIASGAFYLDHSHKLMERMVKDGTLVEVPD
jgi:ankyrin repeat protein